MKTVNIRTIAVGAGIPRVLVSVACPTAEEIVARGHELAPMAFDIAEWRVDHYDGARNPASVLDTLARLRDALGDKPLLFTFRTTKEGGMRSIAPEAYIELNIAAAESGCADAVDVEILAGDGAVRRCIDGVHRAGAVVIGSHHTFEDTASKEELLTRLRKMRDMGADILKLAVMPHSRTDVLTLLCAADEMSRETDCPLAVMSLAPLGAVTRVCGEAFGSALTFAAVGQPSAPGQLPLEQLNTALKILHEAGR